MIKVSKRENGRSVAGLRSRYSRGVRELTSNDENRKDGIIKCGG
jgi:hypothetical protein